MIVFNHIVEIFAGPHSELCRQQPLLLEFAHRFMRSGIPIECELLEEARLLDRLLQESLSRSDIAVFTQVKINGLPRFVHPPVQINPLALDLDIRLVDAPGRARPPSIAPLPLLEFWDIMLYPPHDRSMRYLNAPLGHHVREVPIAQLVRNIPSHA